MKRLCLLILLLFTVSTLAIALATLPAAAQTSTTAWPFYVELNGATGTPGLYDLIVPFHVMDKSLNDLSDLRLFDANGREIPYALRVKREVDDSREIEGEIFNRASVAGNAHEVSVDLGEDHGEHNAVEIVTSGSNFRRRVVVEGSDTQTEWRTLKTGDIIFSFNSDNRLVESNTVSYSPSRFRFLRIRVFADELSGPNDRPEITEVRVMMSVREKGELVTWAVNVPSYQLLRNQGAPASVWLIDLGGRVPVDRVALNFYDSSFSRPFQIEAVDDQNVRLVASGELTRREGDDKPVVVNFNEEEHTRNLRLLVTDHSNPTLQLMGIEPSAPARQLVFEIKEPPAQPLRLYFGNRNIPAPHYDFEKELVGKVTSNVTRVGVGARTTNQNYIPEPLPFTERVPWLIYLVLAASSVALALILISLARRSLQQGPETTEKV
jgi:hypothetical protein